LTVGTHAAPLIVVAAARTRTATIDICLVRILHLIGAAWCRTDILGTDLTQTVAYEITLVPICARTTSTATVNVRFISIANSVYTGSGYTARTDTLSALTVRIYYTALGVFTPGHTAPTAVDI